MKHFKIHSCPVAGIYLVDNLHDYETGCVGEKIKIVILRQDEFLQDSFADDCIHAGEVDTITLLALIKKYGVSAIPYGKSISVSDVITSLSELADVLNGLIENASVEVDYEEYGLDTTDLPTFGGLEPKDTRGIYSWDANNFLIKDDRDWRVVSRI
ncbi:hypothetical protein HZU77_014110 [Neisseriaceae bacterium TC5R-5]|nr:hypothetical protein [Neisseriaceae bacterium TC5R-5]